MSVKSSECSFTSIVSKPKRDSRLMAQEQTERFVCFLTVSAQISVFEKQSLEFRPNRFWIELDFTCVLMMTDAMVDGGPELLKVS